MNLDHLRRSIRYQLRRLRHHLINGDGRWLAWNTYHDTVIHAGLPSYYQLRWNTRRYRVESVDNFAHRSPEIVVAGDLLVYRVDRWFGKRLHFYGVHVAIEVMVAGQLSTFERSRAFGSKDAAIAEFKRHFIEMEKRLVPRAAPQPS
jgi:hypothetical protein